MGQGCAPWGRGDRQTCRGTSASCRLSASTKQPTLKPAGRPTPIPATAETAALTVGGFQKGSGAVRVREQAEPDT